MTELAPRVGPAPSSKGDITLSIKLLFVCILLLKILMCFFMGHFDIYRFLVFLQHAISFPDQDPWSYRSVNIDSDFPYPPTLYKLLKFLVSFGPINATPPHEPAGLLYSLIKAPIFFADLVVAAIICRRTDFRWMVLSYWTSSIVVFHQYYSGQYDLFVATPFILGLYAQEKKGRGPATFYAGLLSSVVLKPFALLFVPALLARNARSIRLFLTTALAIATVVLLFKVSEWPYILSPAYVEQMGSGASSLLLDVGLKRRWLFPTAYGVLLLMIFMRRLSDQWLIYSCVMLTMGAFAFHSAGWMSWAAALLPIVLYDQGCRPKALKWFALWNLTFILRWAYCPTSPMFDSLSVLTDKFLGMSLHLPMGYLYARHPHIGRFDSFMFFGVLFAIASLMLLVRIVADKNITTSPATQSPR